MKTVAYIIGSIAVALVSGAATLLLFALLSVPVTSSFPALFEGAVVVMRFASGFAFVFLGSLVVRSAWRVTGAALLLGLGVVVYIFEQIRYTSDADGLLVWPLLACVSGGLLAVGLQIRSHHNRATRNSLRARATTPAS